MALVDSCEEREMDGTWIARTKKCKQNILFEMLKYSVFVQLPNHVLNE